MGRARRTEPQSLVYRIQPNGVDAAPHRAFQDSSYDRLSTALGVLSMIGRRIGLSRIHETKRALRRQCCPQ